MRLRTSFFAALPFAAALTLAGSGAARAQTPAPAGYTASYFVLDFADGTTTPEYAFQDNYTTGANLTAADLIDQLAAKLTTNPVFTQTYTQYSFGRYYTAFSYGAKSQGTPAYVDSNSPYWGFWVSNDGVTWTQPATYGASTAPLASNVWDGVQFWRERRPCAGQTLRLLRDHHQRRGCARAGNRRVAQRGARLRRRDRRAAKAPG